MFFVWRRQNEGREGKVWTTGSQYLSHGPFRDGRRTCLRLRILLQLVALILRRKHIKIPAKKMYRAACSCGEGGHVQGLITLSALKIALWMHAPCRLGVLHAFVRIIATRW
jgi:hypothetical protein